MLSRVFLMRKLNLNKHIMLASCQIPNTLLIMIRETIQSIHSFLSSRMRLVFWLFILLIPLAL